MRINELLFEGGDGTNGKDLSPNEPFDASQNTELQYLREFASEESANKKRKKKVKSKRKRYRKRSDILDHDDYRDIRKKRDMRENDEDENEDEYAVKAIHSKKKLYEECNGSKRRQCTFYVTEWERYRMEDCTWEP